jgi:uncharacterized repeat protein (TIGR01451 family)
VADLTLTDPLPAGTTFVSSAASAGTCSGTATVVCNLGLVASGAGGTATIVVRPAAAGDVSNTATVSSPTNNDPVPANDSSTAHTTVAPSADVVVTNADTPDPVTIGGNLTYTITVTNNGAEPATGVSLSDPLPAGVSFVSSTPSAGTTCQGTTTVVCTIGDMADNAVATVTIVATTTVAGNLTNTATASSSTPDPDLANNAGTASTKVNKLSTSISLKVAKTATKWTATGAVSPSESGKVTVTWFKKAGSKFKKLSSSKATLNAKSKYTASRGRQAGGSCKATATYPGDASHNPSTKTVAFAC